MNEDVGKVMFDAWKRWIPKTDHPLSWMGTKEFDQLPPLERHAFVDGAEAVKEAVLTAGLRMLDRVDRAAKAALSVLAEVREDKVREIFTVYGGVDRGGQDYTPVSDEMVQRGVDFVAERGFKAELFLKDWGVRQFLEAVLQAPTPVPASDEDDDVSEEILEFIKSLGPVTLTEVAKRSTYRLAFVRTAISALQAKGQIEEVLGNSEESFWRVKKVKNDE